LAQNSDTSDNISDKEMMARRLMSIKQNV